MMRRKLRTGLNILPVGSMVGLMIIGGVLMSPDLWAGKAYADSEMNDDGGSEMGALADDEAGIMPLAANDSVTLKMEGATNLEASAVSGEVSYITKDFSITATGDYDIYVQSSTGNSDLISGATSIPTLSSNNVDMGTVETSAWGYTVAEDAPKAETLRYNAMPVKTSAAIQSGKNVSDKGYRLAFAAYFDDTASAGHYRTNVVLSVAATPEEVTNFYSITYDANGSTAGITPVMQAAESSRESYYFALDEGRDLRKSGYSFIGWAEDKDAADPKYIAGSTISLSSDRPNKTLYAVWREDKVWADITKMQELTPNTCRGLALNTSKQLTDERDSKLYWVTRLADGNCWMTQNLDYDVKTTDIANVIKFDNKTGLAEWPSGNDEPGSETARYYDPGDFYKTDTSNGSSTGCDGIADGFSNAGCIATAGWKTSAANEEEEHFHVGNLYNWYAATKGSWQDANTVRADASDSICPSGWQLPKSRVDANASYGTPLSVADEATTDVRSLAGAYKIARNSTSVTLLRQSPMYFLPGGRVNSGGLHYAGRSANYWSSTASGPSTVYNFTFYSGVVNPALSSGYSYGYSVRCVVPSM